MKETNGKRVSPSALKDIIAKVSKENNLHGVSITPSAIRRRFYRKRIVNHHLAGGQESPLAPIEPIIVEIILQMARIRQCLTPSRALRLVNDLIDGTKIQQDLIQWKKNNTCSEDGKVGQGYWYGFLKRHKHLLVSRRGQKYELNRQNWTTFRNFANMYTHIIHEMVGAGVAEPLYEPEWMDKKGAIVDESKSFGCNVFHRLTRPDMCIVGDEVGGSISMNGDGHQGGTLYILYVERNKFQRKNINKK